MHLFVSYAHVNLCHFFSSSWCQGLAATSACGSSWTFLFTFFPMYVLPITDRKALAIDSLSISWDHIHGYAFPLFHIIPAILNKIHLFQCRIVLVAPLWPQRSWFPDLLQLLVAPLFRLPNVPDLLDQLERRLMHQNPLMLALHVWVLSSNHYISDKKFLREVAEHVSAARRLSTRKVYDAKWTVFTNWCRQRKINPVQASPRIIEHFLLLMFQEKKCQVSTIKGYKSMFSSTLKFKSGTNIGSDPIISELININPCILRVKRRNRHLFKFWEFPSLLG